MVLAGFVVGIVLTSVIPRLFDEPASGVEPLPDSITPPAPGGDTAEPPGSAPPSEEKLFDVTDLPPGHSAGPDLIERTAAAIRQTSLVFGPDGEVLIAGQDPPEPLDTEGDPVEIGAAAGYLLQRGDDLIVTWVERGVSLTLTAPASAGAEAVVGLAESVEVR
jgi:hypothetical protein